jgi:hypothetical protein
MKTKQYASLAILVAAAGALIAFKPQAQSNAATPQAAKLEGAWIAKSILSPVQWSYTLSPDPSGRRAALTTFINVPMTPSIINPNLFPDWEYNTPAVGEMVLIGPDTAQFTGHWYGMKKGFPFNQIVYIGLNSGYARLTASGQWEASCSLAMYAPSADGDGDGLPDSGQNPVVCLPAKVVCTRVPITAPCAQ